MPESAPTNTPTSAGQDGPIRIDKRPDALLVQLASRGDSDALAVLYMRHRPFVCRVAQRACGDHAMALDVLQETFAYLIKKLPALTLTAKLTTYLYPIATNIARSHLRKARRAPADYPHPTAAPEAQIPEPSAALRRAVERLPATHAEVLILKIVEGLTAVEIGQVMKIPEGTVKSRLHHALAALRQDPALRSFFEKENEA